MVGRVVVGGVVVGGAAGAVLTGGFGWWTTGGVRSGATFAISWWRTTAELGAAGPRACTV